jgi:CelD/BcsL family acetyltransferase involved in cellulose biosynthesis
MRIENVTSLSRLEELRGEWEALWSRVRHTTPFQSPAWLIPWLSELASGAELRFVCAFTAGALVGLVPLVFVEEGGVVRATLAGAGISDYVDVLVDPRFEADVLPLLEYELSDAAAVTGWLDVPNLPSWSAVRRVSGFGPRFSVRTSESCPVVSVGDDYDRYFSGLPSWLRRNVRQGARKLSRLGAVRWEIARIDDATELVGALFELHAARWQTKRETGVLVDGPVQAFHRRAAPELVKQGTLRLHALRLDDRVVGVMHVLAGARAYQYVSGFDPSLSEYGPGNLLIAHAISDAIATGRRQYDFLRGTEPYKYAWGACDAPTYHVALRCSRGDRLSAVEVKVWRRSS